MSLLNDALKKAQKAQQRHEPSPTEPLLQPVQPAIVRRAGPARGAIVGIALAVAAGALMFAAFHRHNGDQSTSSTPPPTRAAVAETKPLKPVPPEPASLAQSAIAPVVSSTKPTRTPPSPEPSTAAAEQSNPKDVAAGDSHYTASPSNRSELPAATALSSQAAPALKLEAIYFRFKKPSVRINGRTLFRGDLVDGAKIVSIERRSVHLTLSGKPVLLQQD
jgi:hypothetical protein